MLAREEPPLEREFGRFGASIWRQARGLDERPVDPSRETKSMGREQTFNSDTDDMDAVRATLLECVESAREDMLSEELWARTLTVKVRFEAEVTLADNGDRDEIPPELNYATLATAVQEAVGYSGVVVVEVTEWEERP